MLTVISLLSLYLCSKLANGQRTLVFPKKPGLFTIPPRTGNPSQLALRLELVEKKNVTLTMQGPIGVWFAIAFGASMSSADAIIFSTGKGGNFGSMQVANYKLSDESSSGVNKQASQRWTVLENKQASKNITIKVTRQMFIHGAPGIHNFDMNDSLIEILWARGSHQNLDYHADRAHIEVNMVTGQVFKPAPFIPASTKTHGILMSLAWLVFCPLAVLSSRFRNMVCCTVESLDNTINWFWFHRFFVFLIFVLQVIGFLVKFQDKGWVLNFQSFAVTDYPTGTPHVKLGVACMCWYVIQVIGGLMRPDKYAPNRFPWFVFHRYGGLCLWVFSSVTICYGIIQSTLGIEYIVLFAMTLVAVVLSFIVGTAASNQKQAQDPHHTADGLLGYGEGSVSVVDSRCTN